MPLARIFTRYPERTTALGQQLQQQGYQVEVSSPDAGNLPPADLEIEFEICERADVLDRAADLATQLEADVAVAPGVLQPAAQVEHAPIAAPLSMPNVPNASLSEVQLTQERDAERDFEAAFATSVEPATQEPAHSSSVIEIPVMEQAPMPPVAMLEEPAAMSAEPVNFPVEMPVVMVETARSADPVPYLAQLTPFGTPSPHAESEESIRARSDKFSDTGWLPRPDRMATEAGTSVLQRGASSAAKALAGAKNVASSTAESFREHLQEYKKRAQVRSAESRAAREARLLDLEQRRAEAQQRAVELEAAREAAAARLIELVRQRDPGLHHEERLSESGERDESRRQEDRSPAPADVSQPASAVGSLRHASIKSMRKMPRRPMSPQLRAVLTGAVAVSVLFIVGIVLGAFSPRTPLANPTAHSANGVTVQAGRAAAPAGGVTVTTGPQTASVKRTPTVPSSPIAAQTRTEAKPSPRVTQANRVAAQQNEQAMGDDVVIRHFSRPAPTQKPKQAGQQAGLKHFSDLEN
ncbi:MAG: hypothetical protein WA738_17320 [Candidatus Angelobacter sp.]